MIICCECVLKLTSGAGQQQMVSSESMVAGKPLIKKRMTKNIVYACLETTYL